MNDDTNTPIPIKQSFSYQVIPFFNSSKMIKILNKPQIACVKLSQMALIINESVFHLTSSSPTTQTPAFKIDNIKLLFVNENILIAFALTWFGQMMIIFQTRNSPNTPHLFMM